MKEFSLLSLLTVAIVLLADPSVAHARYRAGMNMYSYVSGRPTRSVDPSGLISYETDADSCELRVVVSYKITFVRGAHREWTNTQQTNWLENMQGEIRDAWNGKCRFRLCTCTACPDGVDVEFDIAFVRERENADYHAQVHGDRTVIRGASHDTEPSSTGVNAEFLFDSVDPQRARFGNSTEQTPVAHEFGHALGLLHPYDYSKEATETSSIGGLEIPIRRRVKPSIEIVYGLNPYVQYATDDPGTSIMGAGMEVRPIDCERTGLGQKMSFPSNPGCTGDWESVARPQPIPGGGGLF